MAFIRAQRQAVGVSERLGYNFAAAVAPVLQQSAIVLFPVARISDVVSAQAVEEPVIRADERIREDRPLSIPPHAHDSVARIANEQLRIVRSPREAAGKAAHLSDGFHRTGGRDPVDLTSLAASP